MRIGIDLGGTKIAGAMVHNGRILRRARRETGAAKGRAYVLAQLRAIIEELSSGKRVGGVGIGVPGVVSGTKIVYLTNIPCLDGVDMGKALKVANLALENDARCFALGEQRYGAARGMRHFVCTTLGTGLGTAIVVDGKLLRGAHGYAGEISHAISDPAAALRGERADWESLLSGPAIMRRHRARGGTGEHPSDIWTSRSPQSGETLRETATLLACYVANISVTLDPEAVLFGGSVSHPALLREAGKAVKRLVQGPPPKLLMCGDNAGVLGAATLVP